MRESEWVKQIESAITLKLQNFDANIVARVDQELPYGYELKSWGEEPENSTIGYKTDLAVLEHR